MNRMFEMGMNFGKNLTKPQIVPGKYWQFLPLDISDPDIINLTNKVSRRFRNTFNISVNPEEQILFFIIGFLIYYEPATRLRIVSNNFVFYTECMENNREGIYLLFKVLTDNEIYKLPYITTETFRNYEEVFGHFMPLKTYKMLFVYNKLREMFEDYKKILGLRNSLVKRDIGMIDENMPHEIVNNIASFIDPYNPYNVTEYKGQEIPREIYEYVPGLHNKMRKAEIMEHTGLPPEVLHIIGGYENRYNPEVTTYDGSDWTQPQASDFGFRRSRTYRKRSAGSRRRSSSSRRHSPSGSRKRSR